MGLFSVSGSVGKEKTSEQEWLESEISKDSKTQTGSSVVTSGSTNTGKTTNNGTTTNSGQTNTSTQNNSSVNVADTISNTTNTNSGSTNTSSQVNTGVNSGSINQSQNTGTTTQNSATQGGSTTVNSGSRNSSSQDAYSNTTTSGPRTQTQSGSVVETQNSGSVNTSQLMLTEEATTHMANQMLEGPQGLAALAKGQNISGGYNSTTQALMTSDLVSRIAGEVAARSAKTVTTIGPSTSTVVDSGSTLTDSGQVVREDHGAINASEVIGGSTSSTSNTSNSINTGTTQNTGTDRIGGSTNTNISTGTQNIGASSNTSATTGRNTNNTTGTVSGTQNLGSSSQSSVNVSDTISNIGGTTTDTTGWSNTLDKILQESVGSKKSEGTKAEAGSKAGWILCTELYKQGRMNKRYYYAGLRAFNSYDEQSKKGYYIWAVPALRHLRKHPFSLRSRVMCSMLNARAEYLAAEVGVAGAGKTVLGFITKHLYWGCWILSRTVARNYQVPGEARIEMKGERYGY